MLKLLIFCFYFPDFYAICSKTVQIFRKKAPLNNTVYDDIL